MRAEGSHGLRAGRHLPTTERKTDRVKTSEDFKEKPAAKAVKDRVNF